MRLKNILEFSRFNLDKDSDVVKHLKKLNDDLVNKLLLDMERSNNLDEKKELVEDILLHISDKLNDEDFHKVEDELKNLFLKNK